jgi:hypothetical protein
VARGRALAVRTRAQPRRREEARRCSSFGDDNIKGGGGGVKGGVEEGSSAYLEGGAAVLRLQQWRRRGRRWRCRGRRHQGRHQGWLTGVRRRQRQCLGWAAIRVSRRWGYSPYTRSFLVSADLIHLITIIFCISWVTSSDTNKPPINTTHTPLFRPSTTVAEATIPTEIIFFKVFFNFL